MKSRYLTLLGLVTIGILAGAAGSTGAATIENLISGANTATILTIAGITDIEQRTIIGSTTDRDAIAPANSANDLNCISIAESQNSDTSLIAIGTIIDGNTQDGGVDPRITNIAA